MKANELRIGNHILLKEKVVQLCGVTDNGFYIYEDRKSVFNLIEKAKPIELTEEILLKCGFYKEKNVIPIYTLGLLSIYWICEDYSKGRMYYNSWCLHKYKPEYLHQLQNLYFALTGEELEINLQ